MAKRSKRAYGVGDLMNREFVTYDFDGEWRRSFGTPERNFKAIVYGASGNGKTDFVVKWAKYLSRRYGKVYYNSFEEGMSQTLKEAFIRNNMQEVAGNLIIGDQDPFEEVMRRMGARNSPKFCIIDSLDFIRMDFAQYKELVGRYKNKSFIFISWAAGKNPKTQAAKDIEYSVDIKVRVYDYKAYPRCRYGGNEPFVIWPEYWEKKALEAEQAVKGSPAPKPAIPNVQNNPPIKERKKPALFTSPTPPKEIQEEDEEADLPLYQLLNQ